MAAGTPNDIIFNKLNRPRSMGRRYLTSWAIVRVISIMMIALRIRLAEQAAARDSFTV